jgi:beta-lactamase class A
VKSGSGFRKFAGPLTALSALLVTGFISQAQSTPTQSRKSAPAARAVPRPQAKASAHPQANAQRPQTATPIRPQPLASPAEAAAQRELQARVQELGRGFAGNVGIAVQDVASGWRTSWNGGRFYPQQSVSKFWVAITALQRVDSGELDLDERVTLTRQDLTLFHQPIARQIGANGYTTTIGDLMFRALTQSDNTCNDAVLRRAGGPDAVREMLAQNRIEGVRFGPGERLMQSQIAGLRWQPAYSVGGAFFQARDSVPMSQRRAAFERYIQDPVDGATPEGIVNALSRLSNGELLSAASSQRLLSIMSQTHTGPQRLTGGLAPGWRISHKTGTGQILGGTQAGYNDIALITSPEGRSYALAVMIGRTSTPLPTRMTLMQNVTRAVIAFDEARGGGSVVYSR